MSRSSSLLVARQDCLRKCLAGRAGTIFVLFSNLQKSILFILKNVSQAKKDWFPKEFFRREPRPALAAGAEERPVLKSKQNGRLPKLSTLICKINCSIMFLFKKSEATENYPQ